GEKQHRTWSVETSSMEVMMNRLFLSLALATVCVSQVPQAFAAPTEKAATRPQTWAATFYRSATVDGVRMFYREAGPADGPGVLLLHGFPTSSHMFRNLMPLLADKYRVIAPDYPGFGQSDAP